MLLNYLFHLHEGALVASTDAVEEFEVRYLLFSFEGGINSAYVCEIIDLVIHELSVTLWLWNRILLFRLACLVNSHHKITYHESAKNQRELS